MKRQLLAEEWNSFARALLSDAGPIQKIEMRRAFYAGAMSLYSLLIKGFTPDREPAEEDLQMMEGLHDELVEFNEKIKKGLA